MLSRSLMAAIRTLAVALALVLTGGLSPGAHLSTASDDDRSADREVFGFLPHWELSRADSIDLETLTTLAWFGVEAGSDGRLVREIDGSPTPGWAGWTSDAFGALQARAQDAGVRVVLTVERFAWDVAGRQATKRLLSDPLRRDRLVDEIVAAVAEAGVDGVNLDFEPMPPSARDHFVRLVRALRRGLDTLDPGLQLTFDLTPDVTSFPLRRLVDDGAADAAVLMAYEYRTASSRDAGSVAPLHDPDGLDVRESLDRSLARAPADRLILAMPWYGRAWSTRSEERGARTRSGPRVIAPSTAVYRVAVPRAASTGRQWDRMQAAAWSVYPSRACATCPVSPRQLWYDDVDSVKAKVGLARRRDLRGIAIWALGYEGERVELWSALRYSLSPIPDTQPPTGSASVGDDLPPASPGASDDGALGPTDGGSVPVVGDTVRLELVASDGATGSGLAFVRVGTGGRLTSKGALREGTTFPAVEAVTVSMPQGLPLDEVFAPGVETEATATATPGPTDATQDRVRVVIRVQWRDVAGNWSRPLRVPVDHLVVDQAPG